MEENFNKRFLTNTDETGRFIVYSPTTHITYYVEPIGDGHKEKWGDKNPITNKMEGRYGEKYTGSVTREESLIKEENGIVNIGEIEGSPFSEIERRDKEYERQIKLGIYKNGKR